LLQPAVQTDDRRRTNWVILIMCFRHTGILQICQRLGVDTLRQGVSYFSFLDGRPRLPGRYFTR
jgi:hypothetical protein